METDNGKKSDTIWGKSPAVLETKVFCNILGAHLEPLSPNRPPATSKTSLGSFTNRFDPDPCTYRLPPGPQQFGVPSKALVCALDTALVCPTGPTGPPPKTCPAVEAAASRLGSPLHPLSQQQSLQYDSPDPLELFPSGNQPSAKPGLF